MPVAVRPSFLLIAVLIGLTGVLRIPQAVAWVLIVFVSILVHELGHALTARAFGAAVAIELNGLGGLTRWGLPDGELTPGRRALVAAAGSATGLAFGGLVWLVGTQLTPAGGLSDFILETTVRVNVFWGLLNWLPIRPLDGGHLVESLLEKVAPDRAVVIARVVFTVAAGSALALAVLWGRTLFIVLAGWLLLSEMTTSRPTATYEIPTLSYDDESAAGETEAASEPAPDSERPEEQPG